MAIMESLSTLPTLPTAIAALLVLITVTFVIRKLFDRKKYYPVAGTVLSLLYNFNNAHDYMTDLSRKYKTYRMLGPFRSEVFSSDPAVVEHILKSNFPNYGKGGYFHNVMEDMMGDGIVNIDGEKWKYQRTAFTHEFSSKNLRDFSMAVFRRDAAKLAAFVSDSITKNIPVDMQDLLGKRTLATMFEVGFGVELDSIYGAKEGSRFCVSFDEVSSLILLRYLDIFWKIKRFFNVGFEAKLRKHLKVVDDFMYKLIRAKVERAANPDYDSSKKKGDLLSRFLDLSDKDPRYLKDICSNFLHAGRDTNASTMSWFMYRMCTLPHLQEKVVQDIKEAVQLKETATVTEFLEKVTDTRVLDKMQYLHAALSEALRLHPPVPVNAKYCFGDDTLPDGFSVKKGDLVSYQPYAMGRMKYIWGEDAEEYRPERWIDEDGRCRMESPFKFPAFQAGPRICAGKEFAFSQMKVFTSVLLHFFAFELWDKKKPVNYKTMITLHIDGPLNLRTSPRVRGKY
ncbi:hypothetical protein IFM89_038383 [Coptis chinensis]|uniref:Cytochrome P450 n=1 Tax=Coptis chinensis TaxID=261450 RepID=A0A835H059_9MAGN|nr:hypothetical protein IFM89_038383 [Coptis chinensis]